MTGGTYVYAAPIPAEPAPCPPGPPLTITVACQCHDTAEVERDLKALLEIAQAQKQPITEEGMRRAVKIAEIAERQRARLKAEAGR